MRRPRRLSALHTRCIAATERTTFIKNQSSTVPVQVLVPVLVLVQGRVTASWWEDRS
jgi:hypothetical protein